MEFKVTNINYLNYPTFAEYFVITWFHLLFVCLKMLTVKFKHGLFFASPLMGPLFAGTPVRPNMLNMP